MNNDEREPAGQRPDPGDESAQAPAMDRDAEAAAWSPRTASLTPQPGSVRPPDPATPATPPGQSWAPRQPGAPDPAAASGQSATQPEQSAARDVSAEARESVTQPAQSAAPVAGAPGQFASQPPSASPQQSPAAWPSPGPQYQQRYGPAEGWQGTVPWSVPQPRSARRRLAGPLLAMLAAALIAFGGGIVVGRAFAPSTTAGAPGLAGFNVYNEALQKVREDFVNSSSVNDKSLVYGSISGMINALGDTNHSRFLTPDEYKQEQQQLSDQLTGIGVIGGDVNGLPSIIRVLPNAPAEKAGIKAGDEIVAVNGTSTNGLTFSQVVDKIRGPAGTSVTLTVLHPNATSPVDVKITRAVITEPLVFWAMVPGTPIADVLLTGFDRGATDQLKAVLATVRDKGATGIVFDLRGNPGGYVNEAIGVASLFLSSGTVYTEEDAKGKTTRVPVDTKQPHTTLPLVVLIDNNTASASEIVSGAIQDAHRAKLVGVRTVGTGTVLSTYVLSDGSALLLGTAKFLTPSGKQILDNGILPDQPVALPQGATALSPLDVEAMSPAQFQSTTDSQLAAAVKDLE